MTLDARRGEFQSPLGREDQNGPIELTLRTGSLGQGVIVLDIQYRFDSNYRPSVYAPPIDSEKESTYAFDHSYPSAQGH